MKSGAVGGSEVKVTSSNHVRFVPEADIRAEIRYVIKGSPFQASHSCVYNFKSGEGGEE